MSFDVAAFKPPPIPIEEREASGLAATSPPSPEAVALSEAEVERRLGSAWRRVRLAAVAGFALPALAGVATWFAGAAHAGVGLMLIVAAAAAAWAAAWLIRPFQGGSADPWWDYDGSATTAKGRAPEAAFLFAASVVVVALLAVQAWLAAPAWVLPGVLGGALICVVLALRGMLGATTLAHISASRDATLRQPWPAAQSMEEALTRREAVAVAARAAIVARRQTAALVYRVVRPASLVALAAPVLPVVALVLSGGADGLALLLVMLCLNLAAALAVGLGLRHTERPSRGLDVATAALCAGLGAGLLWLTVAAQPGVIASLLTSAGQALLAATLVWLTLRVHAQLQQEPPLPGIAHLVDTLQHRDADVRHTAHITLRTLTGADLPESPQAWHTWLQDALERTGKLPRPKRPVSIHEVPL